MKSDENKSKRNRGSKNTILIIIGVILAISLLFSQILKIYDIFHWDEDSSWIESALFFNLLVMGILALCIDYILNRDKF